jgi:hypothetical protein
LTSRPLPGRPSDPFALSDPNHSKRIPRRTPFTHVMEFLREFRKVRNVLLGVYDFDSRISVLPKVPLDKNTMGGFLIL